MAEYDRYKLFEEKISLITNTKLPEKSTDKIITWKKEFRLDKLSYKYYGDPFYDFLILLANPTYVSEFDINIGDYIRIPFPLSQSKLDYESMVKK